LRVLVRTLFVCVCAVYLTPVYGICHASQCVCRVAGRVWLLAAGSISLGTCDTMWNPQRQHQQVRSCGSGSKELHNRSARARTRQRPHSCMQGACKCSTYQRPPSACKCSIRSIATVGSVLPSMPWARGARMYTSYTHHVRHSCTERPQQLSRWPVTKCASKQRPSTPSHAHSAFPHAARAQRPQVHRRRPSQRSPAAPLPHERARLGRAPLALQVERDRQERGAVDVGVVRQPHARLRQVHLLKRLAARGRICSV